MTQSLVAKSLLFALMFSTAAKLTVTTASHSKATHSITFSQTGSDPEPIDPPGSGGQAGN